MEELWGIVDWGVGCLLLIAVAVGGFLLGVRSGRLQERSGYIRMRMRQSGANLYRHKQQLAAYRERVERLEQERESFSVQSEDYDRLQSEWLTYQEKIKRLEREIQMLSSEATSPNDTSAIDVPQLICALREDPLHTNPTKEEWNELMRQTDLLFNHFLTDLRSHFQITRHEQEICCLIKWNFSRKEQLAVFNNTSDALTKSKGRLKKRLGLDEKTDLDAYIRLF